MAKFNVIIVVTLCCVLGSGVLSLPRQYRYYPPAQNRFAGWTVTSQELLALPSQNDPANIFRVAPPAGFLRPNHISRSRRSAGAEAEPSFPYAYQSDVDMLMDYDS